MSLDKFNDLELTRLLRNIIEEEGEDTQKKANDLLEEFSNLPSEHEFDESMKVHKKLLDKSLDRMLDQTQSFIRKIKIYYENEVSRYEGMVTNEFYTYSIDKFIDFAYDISRFLEDNSLDMSAMGITQSKVDDFNSKLFDLRDLNNSYLDKINTYKNKKTELIDNIKELIEKLSE